MLTDVLAVLDVIAGPMFDSTGLGVVLSALALFVVAWSFFVLIVGRRD